MALSTRGAGRMRGRSVGRRVVRHSFVRVSSATCVPKSLKKPTASAADRAIQQQYVCDRCYEDSGRARRRARRKGRPAAANGWGQRQRPRVHPVGARQGNKPRHSDERENCVVADGSGRRATTHGSPRLSRSETRAQDPTRRPVAGNVRRQAVQQGHHRRLRGHHRRRRRGHHLLRGHFPEQEARLPQVSA